MHRQRFLVFGADGLRPDQITRELMPNFSRIADEGVTFSNFYASYPSATRISASTFATGSTPGKHGIVGNIMLVPGVNDDHVVNTEHYQHLEAMEKKEDGSALLTTSLGDVLRRHGGRIAVAGTGSNGHNVLWTYGDRGRIINPTTAYGIPDVYALREKLGPIPKMAVPHYELNDYATRAVTDIFLHDSNLTVIVLWITEPDGAMHRYGIGADVTNDALRDVDACLGRVLDRLDELGIRDQFNILLTSDHGHSTVKAYKTLGDFLVQAKDELGKAMPELVTAGDLAYIKPGNPEPAAAEIEPLFEWLFSQDWVDLVLTGKDELNGIPGTIPLREVWGGHSNHRRPLFTVSPTWSEERNEFGFPGHIAGLTSQAALRATHGTLCPYDVHATLIASGPAFRSGIVNDAPAGLMDIAPTILDTLGLPVPASVDGRVLCESFANGVHTAIEPVSEVIQPPVARGTRDRGIARVRVNGTTYVSGSAFPVATI